ncbi:amidohydrolase family protein [Thermodesulfobacteriota bacterium]
MNQDFLIIDAHTHTYPSAEIGGQALGSDGYGYSGTTMELEEAMRQSNISQAVMAAFTPTLEMKKANIAKLSSNLSVDERKKAVAEINKKMITRMERRNSWACKAAIDNRNLAALIGVDLLQNRDEMVEEVETKVKTFGAKGLKLHPIFNEFNPWDKKMWPVYSKAQELEIPILFHSGVSEFSGYDSSYSHPDQFEDIANSFPDLTIVLAHLGKGFFKEAVELANRCTNIFYDTSACFSEPGQDIEKLTKEIRDIIKKIGIERVMFGSDWPWFNPSNDIAIIRNMELNDHEKSLILGLNAKKIYKL